MSAYFKYTISYHKRLQVFGLIPYRILRCHWTNNSYTPKLGKGQTARLHLRNNRQSSVAKSCIA